MIPGMDPNSVNEIISNFQMFGEISIETEELESGVCTCYLFNYILGNDLNVLLLDLLPEPSDKCRFR